VITDSDIYSDLQEIKKGTGRYKDVKTVEDKVFEVCRLFAKILVSIRTNQLLTEDEKKLIQESRKKRRAEEEELRKQQSEKK